MRARRKLTRVTSAVAMLVAALLVVAVPSSPVATAQPSDDEIAKADAELKAAQVKLGKTFAAFTAADKRHKAAVKAVKTATAKEKKARSEARAAALTEEKTRGRFDQFTGASFREGSTVTSVSALLTSDSPRDMLQQARLLKVLSGEYAQVLDTMTTATAQKTKAEADAKKALSDAAINRNKAATAKAAANKAYKNAVAAQSKAKGEADRLAARKAGLIAADPSASANGEVVAPTVGTLTSGFGPRDGTIHNGQDIANAIGTPIFSAMAGEVIDAGPASGFGQWVRVQHSTGLITVYGHVATFTVTVGQNVAAGDQIATMGNEGQSTGPHLHFEVHQDGTPIDPLPWLRSFGVSI